MEDGHSRTVTGVDQEGFPRSLLPRALTQKRSQASLPKGVDTSAEVSRDKFLVGCEYVKAGAG